jgi:hypothetical protein
MSYIDPDLLHGVLDNVITCINDNAPTLTTNGVTPLTFTDNLAAIRDDLKGKKDARDKLKTQLGVAQQDFAKSATDNYTAFSNVIDTIAGALGKKTPAGRQVLGYRQHVTGSDQHASPQPAPTPAAAAKPSP